MDRTCICPSCRQNPARKPDKFQDPPRHSRQQSKLLVFVWKLEFASASALASASAMALTLEFGVLHPHILVGKLMTCTTMSLTGGVGKLD
ncbi:hypothetical protein DVH24_025789 [Malus domestica]|uniref:Uncharacterized protein n=1 Tax=Malus domestica TaxID=3750 RepID=A0A498KMX5_MALDO|nr:hypothetical protein DVH24_025789 [Malus domestica]